MLNIQLVGTGLGPFYGMAAYYRKHSIASLCGTMPPSDHYCVIIHILTVFAILKHVNVFIWKC